MVNFANWVFERFPYDFWERDSYKDGDGLGLLQRYLMALGQELDSEVTPKISALLDLQDPLIVDEKFLVHLSDVLGNPPDTFYNVPQYRRLLRYITTINKWKGTKKSYDLIFAVLGVTVTLVEEEPASYKYDTEKKFDDQGTDADLMYDYGKCPPCSNYSLVINDPDEVCTILGEAATDPVIYNLLMAIIKYVEPINARLTSVTYAGNEINNVPWVLTSGVWADQLYWKNTGIWRDNPDISPNPWGIIIENTNME